MASKIDFRMYRRAFKTPIVTSHGDWHIREGIILKLETDTQEIRWGEIAPLPWFGSETLREAREFCQTVKENQSLPESIPPHLTACQFGFACATEGLSKPEKTSDNWEYSYLLPAGIGAIAAAQQAITFGQKTFKWKIGVHSLASELAIWEKLQTIISPGKVRLDANGGLTTAEAQEWLRAADASGGVEFIEQPLPPEQLQEMIQLSQEYRTAIALDESVATASCLEACYHAGWRGIYVIKPAIFGYPEKLRQLCTQYSLDLVFSSVFETKIGLQGILQLAKELANPGRALGFGLKQWFAEDSVVLF